MLEKKPVFISLKQKMKLFFNFLVPFLSYIFYIWCKNIDIVYGIDYKFENLTLKIQFKTWNVKIEKKIITILLINWRLKKKWI